MLGFPYAVVGVSVLTVFIMLGVLGREGLGPWSSLANRNGSKKAFSDEENKRSLDADEEAE